MPTSCNTHDYDGQLREKWFEMRSMLIERYLPNCLSFDATIHEIEQWLNKKYFNAKRIARARRSLRILTTQRRSNFDSRNEIDVEELLPILWDKVKNQEDIHDTFYEQFCDITGGSCSQGRSTRLFQFLFLFDIPFDATTNTSKTDEKDVLTEQETSKTDLPPPMTTTDSNLIRTSEEKQQQQQQPSEESTPLVEQSTEEKQPLPKEAEVNEIEEKNLSSNQIE